VARYRFWNLAYRECFRDFLCALREHAALCKFAEKDNIIRDKIAFAVPRSLRETLLREPKLTLTRAVELSKAWETSREQAAEMAAKTEEVQCTENLGTTAAASISISHQRCAGQTETLHQAD